MSLDTLLQAIEENPSIQPSTSFILPHVDGPSFFEDFLSSKKVGKFKSELYQSEPGLVNLIKQKPIEFGEFMRSQFPTLDDLNGKRKSILLALDIKGDRSTFAKKSVDLRLYSTERPANHPITGGSGGELSEYFSSEIVGESQMNENIKTYIQERFSNLDDLTSEKCPERKQLAKIMDLASGSLKQIALACIKLDILSPKIPEGHIICKKGQTKYLNPEIVGEEQVLQNLKKYIQTTYPTLDELNKRNCLEWRTLSKALNIEEPKTTTLVKKIVDLGIISPELPRSHPLNNGMRLSYYVSSDTIGEEQVQRNLKKYIDENFPTLNHFTKNKALSSVLGLEKMEAKQIIKELVKRDLVNTELPEGYVHVPFKNRYFDSALLGRSQALINIQTYLQRNYESLEGIDITEIPGIIYKTITQKKIDGHNGKRPIEFKRKLQKLGWFDSESSTDYANGSLPSIFQKNKKDLVESKGKKQKETVAPLTTTTFIKGEALEQLVGLVLSYQQQNELVIPQYCLDVGPGWFKTRADFRVGDNIYEVKWGLAEENIKETYEKHQRLLTNNSKLSYDIIKLENGNDSKIPYTLLDDLIEDIEDPTTKENLYGIAFSLMESASKEGKEEHRFLEQFRDFFYNLIDKANSLTNNERRTYINTEISKVNEFLDDKTTLENYFTQNINRHFSTFEAHFHYNGELYRQHIDPITAREELSYDKELMDNLSNPNLTVLIEDTNYVASLTGKSLEISNSLNLNGHQVIEYPQKLITPLLSN